MFCVDLKSSTEAAFLPPEYLCEADVSDYKEELVLSLSSARELAVNKTCKAQQSYKKQIDKKARQFPLKVGDWVFAFFSNRKVEETLPSLAWPLSCGQMTWSRCFTCTSLLP